MTTSKESPMGDLIRFPHPRHAEQSEVDGTAAPAVVDHVEDVDTASRVPERAEEAPHRAAHIPEVLRRDPAELWRATKSHGATAVRFTARHGYYLGAGAWDTLEGAYKRRTGRDVDERIAAAQAAGDHGTAAQLMQIRATERKTLLDRLRVWLELGVKLPKALGYGALVALAATLIVAVAAQIQPGGLTFATTWTGLFTALATGWEWTLWAASWAPWAGAALVAGVLIKGYNTRRRRTAAPEWLLAGKDTAANGGVLVTADGIVRALQKLGIPALNSEFKNGWVPHFSLPPTREGHGTFKGYRARFSLPEGVPVDKVVDKRAVLAHNLHRAEIEVWPADFGKVKDGQRGYVDLYVADAGVMEQPTPEYPLLHAGTADVFAGVPVGINQRGEEQMFPLVGANAGVGGQPGQGKSNLMRVTCLGAALDPLAELRMHVFAGNGDFDEYKPRLSRYDKGADAAHVERAVAHLHELYAEVERRESRLAELGAKKLSRGLADKHADLRPLLVGFSECHELFGNKEHGEEAAELAIQVVKRGRKTGLVTLYDTQSSRASAIPPALVELLGINACFFVKSWRSNDGFLGDGSFAAGIRATDLRFNIDRGTCVATGISEELFEIVRTFYIEVDDDTGWDAATEVIARAMQTVDPHTAVSGDRPITEPEVRDLLADVAEVLGDEDKVKATDVAARLRKLAPHHRPYQGLGADDLRELLGPLGVKVTKSSVLWVYAERVHQALADREGGNDTN